MHVTILTKDFYRVSSVLVGHVLRENQLRYLLIIDADPSVGYQRCWVPIKPVNKKGHRLS